MTRIKQLTPEQLRAMAFINMHGAIARYEGGFWSKPDAELDGVLHQGLSGITSKELRYPKDYVGTNTIDALARRGLIVASKTKEGRRGSFVIEYILNKPKT